MDMELAGTRALITGANIRIDGGQLKSVNSRIHGENA